MPSMYVRN